MGTLGAVAYAGFLLYGLRTWWRGAVGTGLLTLHVSAESLAGGGVGGVVIAWLCVLATLRSLRRASPRDLLGGTRGVPLEPARGSRRLRLIAAVAAVCGVGLVAAAFAHAIPDAAGFFGAGTLLLIAAIVFEWARLRGSTGNGR